MTGRSGRSGRSGRAQGARHEFRSQDDSRQVLGMALELHQAGQLSRAKALYEQVLAQQPDNADALQFFGLLTFQTGDPARARSLIERAIAAKPGVAPYHDNLGKVLESLGRLDEALEAFERAAALEPGVADRSFNMGVVTQRMGRPEDAERHYREALARQSDDPGYHLNLANLLYAQRRFAEAVDCYRQALSLKSGGAEIVASLGQAMTLGGDAEGALQLLEDAAREFPANSSVHSALGNALRQTGALDAAVQNYRQALRLDPESLDARCNLGGALVRLGRMDEAVQVYLQAGDRLQDSLRLRRGFVAAARYLLPQSFDPALERALLTCVDFEDTSAQELAHLIARQLCLKRGLDGIDQESLLARSPELIQDPLLLRLLTDAINVEPVLERALTEIRRGLLTQHASGGPLNDIQLRFTCALAQQCFSNEYVFAQSEDEAAAVALLEEALVRAAEAPESRPRSVEGLIALVGCYRPLHALACATALAKTLLTLSAEAVRALVQRALLEPLEETRLLAEIPRATPIADATSVAVRAQYEVNPYPRWLNLPPHERRSYGEFLRRRFPHFDPPARLDREVSVLVLGCGTGQEAVAVASGREVAKVTAIDLSLASLAYGRRMAEMQGIDRLEFLQADALELRRLGQQFDVIESSGVLHHLEDPMAGWTAARDCLAPGGVMKLGLYSERARTDILAAREAIAAAGLEGDLAGIREIRRRVFEAPVDDPLAGLAGSEDLYTTSACRDLLFHVCEHRFSLPGIQQSLDKLGLHFVGFELPLAFVRHRYQAFNPADSSLVDLDAWDRFEAQFPDTFAGMYVFWCYKPE